MRKILVANRGEIACRVIRSARNLGIETVAVFSEADATALHVHMADEAYPIGPSPARESYLRAETILQVAKRSGADALHPGYGFLAENADFAEAVIAAGLTWVGPAPCTIRMMGDKQTARETAERAGIPIVPGSRRFVIGKLGGVAEAAVRVGFPLLIKSAAGGGGIGMRRVDRPEELEQAARMVQEAAQKSFGNGDIYLERFVPRARHIEVQVMGYGDGSAIHLFERDCSLQRRFQKVIEEAPAPNLPEIVRNRMTDAALALCAMTKYVGAGTIEFIVDAQTFEFFFMEMNTRIQVEHPVSEMVTGVDLVAMQIQIAANGGGERIGTSRVSGAAIECRLYAENPAKMFFPSPGRLNILKLPEAGPNVRIESGYREGDVITSFYDPLVAKIIAHGRNRREAIEIAQRALAAVEVDGLTTNRDFLLACLGHASFQAGDVHTKFIDASLKELIRGDSKPASFRHGYPEH